MQPPRRGLNVALTNLRCMLSRSCIADAYRSAVPERMDLPGGLTSCPDDSPTCRPKLRGSRLDREERTAAAMSTHHAARAQSRRLERLGIDVTPQRLREIHVGAQPHPGEFDSVRPTKANAWIRRGVSPEKAAESAVKRDLIKLAAGIALLIVFACLLVWLFADLLI